MHPPIYPLLLFFFVVVDASSGNELSSIDNNLFEALRYDDAIAASTALNDGANINAISPKGGQTPLMQSVLHGRVEMVHWCLENGADTSIAEKDGYTPMHGAAFQGHAPIVRLLMEHGVSLRSVHSDGFEPASEYCSYITILSFFYDSPIAHSTLLIDTYIFTCFLSAYVKTSSSMLGYRA